jgi:hypothetical protein
MPTMATRVLPSSNTAARTLQGSWKARWYALPYPPGCSMPIAGEMSCSAKPTLNSRLSSAYATAACAARIVNTPAHRPIRPEREFGMVRLLLRSTMMISTRLFKSAGLGSYSEPTGSQGFLDFR